MRKKLFYGLIAAFIIQLFVPAFMIGYSVSSERNIEAYGKEYDVKINPYGVTDENEILFNVSDCFALIPYEEDRSSGYVYAQFDVSADGTAYVKSASFDKPDSPYYIRSDEPSTYWSFPKKPYFTDKDCAESMREYIAERKHGGWFSAPVYEDEDMVTLKISVYEGKMIMKGIYINGTPMEEYFADSNA